MPWDNPLDTTNSNPSPQPFTGGSNIAPMPVSTARDNPFTDVLNHVGAFNAALSNNGGIGIPSGPFVPPPTGQPGTYGKGGISIPSGPFIPPPPSASKDALKGVEPKPQTVPPISLPPRAYSATATPPPDETNGGGTPSPVPSRGQQTTPPATPSDPRTHPSAPPVVYTDANPPPRPSEQDMANPETAAAYYRLFGTNQGLTGYNPAFANITGDDVNAQRNFAVSGGFAAMGHSEYQDFGTWYLAGKPTPPAANAGPPTVSPQPGEPVWGPQVDYWGNPIGPAVPPPAGGNQPPLPTEPPVIAAPPGPGGISIPPGPFDPNGPHPGGTPPPNGPKPGDPGGATGAAPPDIQSLIDMFQREAGANNGPNIESMLNPMFARQRQQVSDQMRAQAALTPGRIESGGFGQNEGQAISDLSGKQSATMADALQQQHLAQMQQNTQLMTLATNAGMQKYVTDINADLTRFQVNTNADLQRWLDTADNTLKKYGIDTGDVLARYQAELQLKGQMYSADRGVDAASLQAAAAHAAAAASSAASQANAQLQYQLGMQGLNVDREKNIGQFILGLLGMGNMDINSLNGILNGLLPGTTVVRP